MSEESGAEVADVRARTRPRVLTHERAAEFARVLASDVAHTVESAAIACGLKPSTVREALSRYENDRCGTDEDEEICEVLARAKSEHIMRIRRDGFLAAESENKAATSWAQWQLEVQAPKEHPRKQVEVAVGASANAGGEGPAESRVQIHVTVPPYESE